MIYPLRHPIQSCPPTTIQHSGLLSRGIGMVWVRVPLTSRTYTLWESSSTSRKLEWLSVVTLHTDCSPWGWDSSLPDVGTPCRYITSLSFTLPTRTVPPRTDMLNGVPNLQPGGSYSLYVTLSWATSTRQTVLLIQSQTYSMSGQTTAKPRANPTHLSLGLGQAYCRHIILQVHHWTCMGCRLDHSDGLYGVPMSHPHPGPVCPAVG